MRHFRALGEVVTPVLVGELGLPDGIEPIPRLRHGQLSRIGFDLNGWVVPEHRHNRSSIRSNGLHSGIAVLGVLRPE